MIVPTRGDPAIVRNRRSSTPSPPTTLVGDADRSVVQHSEGDQHRDRRAASRLANSVVTDGVDKLQPGAKVEVRQPDRHAAGPKAATNEPVASVHPAAGRDVAADGRRSLLAGAVALPAAPGLGAAAGRLPDDPGRDVLSGRESRRHGVGRHRAARAAVRPAARLEPDDLHELRRALGHHAAVRRSI